MRSTRKALSEWNLGLPDTEAPRLESGEELITGKASEEG